MLSQGHKDENDHFLCQRPKWRITSGVNTEINNHNNNNNKTCRFVWVETNTSDSTLYIHVSKFTTSAIQITALIQCCHLPGSNTPQPSIHFVNLKDSYCTRSTHTNGMSEHSRKETGFTFSMPYKARKSKRWKQDS